MSKKDRSIEDYKIAVIKAKQSYQMDKMNYNWNFTFKEENLNDSELFFFMIVNHSRATKIIWDNEQKVLVEKDIYTTDVNTMKELQGQL